MYTFKKSSLKEREEFYKNEFDIEALGKWFKKDPQFFAVDCGTETGIIKDKTKAGRLIILQVKNLKELRQKLLKYLPEDVYYDRNTYKDPKKALQCLKLKGRPDYDKNNWVGQELAFDIDAGNIKCKYHKQEHRSLCPHCLKKALKQGRELYFFLKELGFKELGYVYSGRGCHVHVYDEKAFKMSIAERGELNKKVKFGIDSWVSRGKIRLIRLPYSLNALVSRIVTPLDVDTEFNPMTEAIPKFHKTKTDKFEVFRL